MRFYDLGNLSDEVVLKTIAECPKVEMKKVLENPELLLGKVLVFRGNYDGYATNRPCARTFEYLPAEDTWIVSDFTLYDMFGTSFAKHFTLQELEVQFKAFCDAEGFVMDA